MRARDPVFFGEWPEDWPQLIAAVAEFYGGGWDPVAALTLPELRLRYGAAVKLSESRRKALE